MLELHGHRERSPADGCIRRNVGTARRCVEADLSLKRLGMPGIKRTSLQIAALPLELSVFIFYSQLARIILTEEVNFDIG